jgi:hypothetical protein
MMVIWVVVTFIFSCGVEIRVDDHDDDGGDVLVMFSNHYLFVFSLFACWFVVCLVHVSYFKNFNARELF